MDHLEPYMGMFDEITRTMHCLIYDSNHSDYNGLSAQNWSHKTWYMYTSSTGQRPMDYFIIGGRMLIIDTNQQEFESLSSDLVLAAIASACAEEICDDSDKQIFDIDIYSVWSRKIWTIKLGNWDRQLEFLDFLRSATKDNYNL